jgi:hypothetical protein
MVAPDTEHTLVVVEVKVTPRPEEAVADTVKAGVPYVLVESAPKVIVCAA